MMAYTKSEIHLARLAFDVLRARYDLLEVFLDGGGLPPLDDEVPADLDTRLDLLEWILRDLEAI